MNVKKYIIYRTTIIFGVVAAMFLIGSKVAMAQQFSVSSFRQLENDITAYIAPVADLNDEACALVKIMCNNDFAFSSPLGIVKRTNEVGEVWLYLPKGSVLLTIKHPQWGVLRDYRFPKVLESRVTYELKLNTPALELPKDSIVVVQKDTVLVRDTVISKTIVEVPIEKVKVKREPVKWMSGASVAFGNGSPAYGVRAIAMRLHGFYIAGLYNFTSISSVGECNSEGVSTDGTPIPYDTGNVEYSYFATVAGAIHKIYKNILLYEGVGYGKMDVAYEKVTNEYWLNKDDSCKGFAAEIGLLYNIKRISVSAGIVTIAGRYWLPEVGLVVSF